MMDAAEFELFGRTVAIAVDTHDGADLDAALDDLGWANALDADRRAAISTLFAALGATPATSSALSRVLATELGIDRSSPIVLPALGRTDPPGTVDHDNTIVVDGLCRDTADALVVVALDTAITVDPSALSIRPLRGIDPGLGLVRVTGEASGAPGPTVDWASAVALAQLALAHELMAASRRMLDLAREHALERIQFGQPIARFQAVRHRLAETLVSIEAAEALADAAWLDGSPRSAVLAKAGAGTAARTAARHCQQVLAGIGFTTEHPLHRFIRRVLVVDQLFGSSRALTRAIGEELLATRQLPTLLPL